MAAPTINELRKELEEVTAFCDELCNKDSLSEQERLELAHLSSRAGGLQALITFKYELSILGAKYFLADDPEFKE